MEVILTKKAKLTLQHIFDFIEEKWGEKVADDFLFKVEKTLKLLTVSPDMFKLSKSLNARKGIISKQTSFIYRVGTSDITVLYFWDTRQKPIE